MAGQRAGRLDLGQLLAAVEDAPPVAAADVLGARLGDALGAREVSFLIADFSGRALIRLGHAGSVGRHAHAGPRDRRARAAGRNPHGRAMPAQTVEVEAAGGERGVRAGDQPRRGDRRARAALTGVAGRADASRTSRSLRTRSRTSSSPTAASPTSSSGASARSGSRSPPRSSIACCPAPTPARPGSSRSRRGWSPPATSAATRFDFAMERDTLHLSMTDAMGHEVDAALLATCSSARCATRGGPASGSPSRRALANDGLGRRRARRASSPGRSRASTCAPAPRRSSTPGIRLRCGCATDASSPSSSRADPPFGIVRGHDYRVQALPLRAGRPPDVPHRRHARAQRRQTSTSPR